MKNVGGKRDAQQPRMVGDLLPLAAITAGVSVQSCDSWLFKVGYRDILALTTTSNCPPLAPPPLSRTIAAATAAAATAAAAAAATSFAAAPWGDGVGTIEKPQNM